MFINKPNQRERAYIAGFVDGEGCVSVAHRLRKYITPFVQISNTNYDVLAWIGSFYGVNVYTGIEDSRPTRRKSYRLALAGQKALNIIRDTYPHLRIKKPQADILLSIKRYETTNRDKLGRIKGVFNREIELENEKIVAQIRELNRRGNQ